MDQAFSIHVPPFFEVPEQDSQGGGISTDDCPSVAEPTLVPPALTDYPVLLPEIVSRRLSPVSSSGTPSSSSLACVWRAGNFRGLSERVVSVIQNSWRESTESAYSNAWKQWNCWCLEWGTDPLSAPLSEVLEFLCEQFDSGKQHWTIKSAISMTHDEVDGLRVGQHPLVSCCL